MYKYQHLIISRLAAFTFHLLPLLFFLLLPACGKNRKPGLSDKELFAQQPTTDTLKQAHTDFDPETYIVPPGAKYIESRAIDPANPPVMIDIANRNLNIKKFDLSDYYTKVRYIKLKHPMPAEEGNFLFDAKYDVSLKQGAMSGSGLSSKFSFLKDSIIAGDYFFGFHSYDYEGNFLHTIKTFNFSKVYDVAQNTISYDESDFRNAVIGENNNNNRNQNRFRIDDSTMVSYVYNRMDTLKEDFLYTFNVKGDTLCRFKNYNPKPNKRGAPLGSPPSVRMYFLKKIFTIQQAMNDTVYRMTSPNRLTPAYILNYGPYKLDIAFAEDFSDKFFPAIWKETGRYVLFTYNRNYDSPNNRGKGLVKFFYSYFDKQSRQFYHFCEETVIPEQDFLMENPVPDALPFILSSANIEEERLWVCYTKKRLEKIIINKAFASLSSEQQSKLKTLQNELQESEVLIMILE